MHCEPRQYNGQALHPLRKYRCPSAMPYHSRQCHRHCLSRPAMCLPCPANAIDNTRQCPSNAPNRPAMARNASRPYLPLPGNAPPVVGPSGEYHCLLIDGHSRRTVRAYTIDRQALPCYDTPMGGAMRGAAGAATPRISATKFSPQW